MELIEDGLFTPEPLGPLFDLADDVGLSDLLARSGTTSTAPALRRQPPAARAPISTASLVENAASTEAAPNAAAPSSSSRRRPI
jgi:hypothetical protein